ncbi:hypothetical protein B484DRAFT_415501 [Ochromonadaceae sp. CCMP2298]|nr:hypothetical protein B484DRAFT_415501 [Ochromonadaceae sp. CCMP2298]
MRGFLKIVAGAIVTALVCTASNLRAKLKEEDTPAGPNHHVKEGSISTEELVSLEKAAELYFQAQKGLREDYKLVAAEFTRVEANYPCVAGVIPLGGVSPDAVYDGHNFGSFKNQFFEMDLLRLRPDAKVWIYELDPKQVVPEAMQDSRVTYLDVGLGGYADEPFATPEGWKMQSMGEMMTANGHPYIDVLKMDIEGGEYPFIRHEVDLLSRVGQLLIEIHINANTYANIGLVDFIDRIEARGLRLFHSEINIHRPFFCMEFSFVQSNWVEWNHKKTEIAALHG